MDLWHFFFFFAFSVHYKLLLNESMNLMTRSMWKYDSNLTLTDPCVSASCIKSLRKWYNILKPSSLSKIHLFLLRYGLYKSIVTKNPNVCNTLQWTRGSEICRKQWACVEILIRNNGHPFTSPLASTTIISLLVITLFHLIVY